MTCNGCHWQGNKRVCTACRKEHGAPGPETVSLPTDPPKPSKHNAVLCDADGIRFPSKKHRAVYLRLRAEQAAGAIRFFLREVPFDLPGHYKNGKVVRHFVDFQIIDLDGRARWLEVKGRDLAMGKLKRLQVEELYGIKIVVE